MSPWCDVFESALLYKGSVCIKVQVWINHEQSARQQGAIYKLDWEGIQYNMIDTTSFMLGNLQSIFLPTKTKRFHK